MKSLAVGIGIACILSAAICRAENDTIRHELAVLNTSPRQIEFSEGNTIGTTSLVTYTCANGADFGVDLQGYGRISLRIPKKKNSKVTLTALEELKGFTVYYWPGVKCNDIAIELSRDSITWTRVTGGDIEYGYGLIRAKFPRHTYYVRVRNTDNNDQMSIYEFRYVFEHCNCFEYEGE